MQKPSIADINDDFRKGNPKIPGKVVATSGINSFSQPDIATIIKKVQEFDNFNEDNDPYGEHDFGSFTHNDEKIFWKVDYYDPTLQYHSEDPTDLSKTVRVLTIMLAQEY